MTVWVLTSSSGFPEDGGYEVHGIYGSLERCFREVARYCKGNSKAFGPDDHDRYCMWVTGQQTDRYRNIVHWKAEPHEVVL